MNRIMRILLVVGLLVGGLAIFSPSSEAGPRGRGPIRRGGWGRVYGPGYGYRVYPRAYGYGRGGYGAAYRPFGWGYRGYGWGYPGYRWGYPGYGLGYPGYGINNPALGVFGVGNYPGYGFGYPGYYGTSLSIGSPLGGFFMRSYPY
jgi:hypothetical protein